MVAPSVTIPASIAPGRPRTPTADGCPIGYHMEEGGRRMSGVERAEVVVVGGGVIGTSIAYHLARAGVGVTLLEWRSIAAGASGASARGVRQQGRDPRELPLALGAAARWATLEEGLGFDLD